MITLLLPRLSSGPSAVYQVVDWPPPPPLLTAAGAAVTAVTMRLLQVLLQRLLMLLLQRQLLDLCSAAVRQVGCGCASGVEGWAGEWVCRLLQLLLRRPAPEFVCCTLQ